MSLNQKYTWKDFLKDNPVMQEKGIKRTSSEGEKAFKAAFKTKVKEYLSNKDQFIDKVIEKANGKRKAIIEKVKTIQKNKEWPKAKFYQTKIGKQDAAISNLVNEKDRNSQKRKSL